MKTWTVSKLINEKPGIVKNTSIPRAKVVTVIITFFKFAMIEILKGNTLQLPFGSTIAVYKQEARQFTLKRSRFKKIVEPAVSRRGMTAKYCIVADAGPRYNKTFILNNYLIKLEASNIFRKALHKILTNTNHEYQKQP